MTSHFRCEKHSASCFAVCRCWKVQALLFCIVLRCLLEGSSFIAVWSASYFVMLKNFVGVIYQSLRKVCATSGPCTSTRMGFVLNGSRCLIELTRCGRKSNQPSSVSASTKINHAFSQCKNFRSYYSNLPILERTFLIYDYY